MKPPSRHRSEHTGVFEPDPPPLPDPQLGPRFAAAASFALLLHAGQCRKGGRQPYAGHLLGVAALAIAYGADEDTAIAALLHDAAEDQGGAATLERIRAGFGDRVAGLVRGASDSLAADPACKAPWHERKQQYLAHLATAGADARLIAVADKLHNAQATLADLRVVDAATVWSRFATGRADWTWYHREVIRICAADHPQATAELERTIAMIDALDDRPAGR